MNVKPDVLESLGSDVLAYFPVPKPDTSQLAELQRVAEEVITLTGGAHAVLECVGAQPALSTAIAVARDGATIGYVGVPHLVEGLDLSLLFGRNIDLAGGVTPARTYLPELMTDIALGTIDASPIFDASVDLAGVPDGYLAMDGRKAVKVRVDVSTV